MFHRKGSRAAYDDDDDDEDWVADDKRIETKPVKKKLRKPRVTKVLLKTFNHVDPQLESMILSRVPTVVRLLLLTKNLGFRDCLYFARSCKMTYLDMVSNPLFLRYYVRGLLHRHVPRCVAITGSSTAKVPAIAPCAALSSLSFIQTRERNAHNQVDVFHTFLLRPSYSTVGADLSASVDHIDDAKRALETPEFKLPAENYVTFVGSQVVTERTSTYSSWPALLSSILLTWERGGGGCLSTFCQKAQQVLFFLLHTFDLEGSVFASYFSDVRYQVYYRDVVFGYRGPVLDFWVLLESLMSNRIVSFGKADVPCVPFIWYFQQVHRQKYATSSTSFYSMYNIHEKLAWELHVNHMEPLIVPCIRELCSLDAPKFSDTAYIPLKCSGKQDAILCLRRHVHSNMVSLELQLDAVGLPALLGLQEYTKRGGLFHPRRTLWLEWRDAVEQELMRYLQ